MSDSSSALTDAARVLGCATGRLILLLVCAIPMAAGAARAADLNKTVASALCRQYLDTRDSAQRQRLASRLAEYSGDFAPVLEALQSQEPKPVAPGYHPAEHFSAAELLRKHPDRLLYFVVPESYQPNRPTGLIVFLHGGGVNTSRRAPQATLSFPDADTPPYSSKLGDLFAATGMITVGASAPAADTSYRWCVREADDYLLDIILECKSRFNIDPDRVILLGHSMGGFGAYQHALRQPDRFAAVVANSGSWAEAYWPAVRGTPLCIIQGRHDARPGVRWHYTDVEFGRWTDRLLTELHLDHTYLERDGNHAIGYSRDILAQFFSSAGAVRRDPFYPHIALATPNGFGPSHSFSIEHNRWLSLQETTSGNLDYDELVERDTGSFASWHLEHRVVRRHGAAIEAVNRGDNTILVTTRNVAKFTVWLHPGMVDLRRPVTVIVDGRVRVSAMLKPSLATALESYERRTDWGLIYPVKMELTIDR